MNLRFHLSLDDCNTLVKFCKDRLHPTSYDKLVEFIKICQKLKDKKNFPNIMVGAPRKYVIIGQKIFQHMIILQCQPMMFAFKKGTSLANLDKIIGFAQEIIDMEKVNIEMPNFKDLHEEDHEGMNQDLLDLAPNYSYDKDK